MVQHCINLVLFSRRCLWLTIDCDHWLGMNRHCRHLQQEEEFFDFSDVSCDVLEVSHARQPIVLVRIAFFLNLVQARLVVSSAINTTCGLLVETLKGPLRRIICLLGCRLPDRAFENGALELWALHELVDDVYRSK